MRLQIGELAHAARPQQITQPSYLAHTLCANNLFDKQGVFGDRDVAGGFKHIHVTNVNLYYIFNCTGVPGYLHDSKLITVFKTLEYRNSLTSCGGGKSQF